MNEWAESEDRLASLADLEMCVTHEGPLAPRHGVPYVLGLDIGIVRDRTAAALCHLEPVARATSEHHERHVVVDDVVAWQGSQDRAVQIPDVREWLLATAREYRDVRIVFDPNQAILLSQDLRARGILMEQFNFSQASVARLASTLLIAIRNHTIALPNDADLLAELSRIRLRETGPNLLRLDHGPNAHDDRGIALAMAAERLLRTADSHGPRLRWLR